MGLNALKCSQASCTKHFSSSGRMCSGLLVLTFCFLIILVYQEGIPVAAFQVFAGSSYQVS